MINVSTFVKEHISLCICTLGLAIVGYLGYHAVRWIINKCQRTEKIDQVARRLLDQQSFSPASNSLINRVSNLETSQDKITLGQGEYIVFHKMSSGEKLPLSRETFEQVYKVLLQHSPATLANSGSEKAMEECANRSELLKAELKEIDPTLEAVFVPKTLYELIFIRKCIQEDLKHNKVCSFLSPASHEINLEDFEGDQQKYESALRDKETKQKERKCWHLCYFTDEGDSEHVGVKNVAYRLNKVMLKAFDPSSEGFTQQEFSALAEKEIEFFKAHYKKGQDEMARLRKGEKINAIGNCNASGPTINFGYESTRGSAKPMGIRDETDAQIIRDAIALECSKIAQHSLFIYRGADFQKDSTSCWNNKDKPYSLSYGSSLFAGCLYDGGATAFHYMRNEKNAYAIPVPFDQLNDSPFFIPTTHTVAQLSGKGEIFHARTKAWKDFDVKKIEGVSLGLNSHIRDHLRSNLSQEELNSQFRTYKNKAFQLK